MSESGLYVAQLVRSDSMKPIIGLNDDLSAWTFKPIYNKPGTYEFTLPLLSGSAALVKNRKTGVLLTRNGRPIWSGGLTSIVHDGEANDGAGTTSCVATGWMEEYDHRNVRKDEEATLSFPDPGTVGGTIFGTLMATASAQTSTSGVVRPLRASFDEALDAQVRIRTYKEGDNYGTSLTELVEIEDGVDIYIDPLTKLVTTRDPAAFSIRPKVIFGYNIAPFNLANCTETDDGSTIFNRENAVGANGGVVSVDDDTAIDDAGVMLEEWISLSDVSDPSILGAYANEELVYKRYGTLTYSLVPNSFGDLPRPYDDFEWGDLGYLSAVKGAMQIRGQAVRLFSGSLTQDDSGNELISDIQVALA